MLTVIPFNSGYLDNHASGWPTFLLPREEINLTSHLLVFSFCGNDWRPANIPLCVHAVTQTNTLFSSTNAILLKA